MRLTHNTARVAMALAFRPPAIPTRTRALFALFVAVAFGATTPVTAWAQTVVGRVTEQTSGNAVPGVFITILDAAGRPTTAAGFSNESGVFSVQLEAGGTYRIRAEMLGFQRFEMEGIEVPASSRVRVDVALMQAPVRLDTLEARAAPLGIAEEYSMTGVRRRHAETPKAGPARVFMRPDPELVNAMTVGDVLRWTLGAQCTVWFVNGFRIDWPVSDMSADMFEAVEVYRTWADVPFAFRTDAIGCGVIAVWSRLPGGEGGKKLTLRRVLLLGGIVGAILLITR